MSPPDPPMTDGEREDIRDVLVFGLHMAGTKPSGSRLSEGRHIGRDFAKRLSAVYIGGCHEDNYEGIAMLIREALQCECATCERERAMLEQLLAEELL